MSSSQIVGGNPERLDDLASLACRAAIQIDDLLLERGAELSAVSDLVTQISGAVTKVDKPALPNSLLDPTTAIAVNQAIQAAFSSQALQKLDQLVKEADRITQRLIELSRDPAVFRAENAEELGRMRTFCLALSRSFSALTRPPEDFRPDHPLRR